MRFPLLCCGKKSTVVEESVTPVQRPIANPEKSEEHLENEDSFSDTQSACEEEIIVRSPRKKENSTPSSITVKPTKTNMTEVADVMVSLQVASTKDLAQQLVEFLEGKGLDTWYCLEMSGGTVFREEIVVNASQDRAFVPLINTHWAESKECIYEFNIAQRCALTQGFPKIIPVILDPHLEFKKYPLLVGLMANTNCLFMDFDNPHKTFEAVLSALSEAGVEPLDPNAAAPISKPSGSSNAPSSTEYQNKDLRDWSISDVGDWVSSLEEIPSQKGKFKEQFVDGIALSEITVDDLVESFKYTPVQARYLWRFIGPLKTIHPKSALATSASRTVMPHNPDSPFKTGWWQGRFIYSTGGSDPFSMNVTMVVGVVSGYGSDCVGDFFIHGTFSEADLTIKWDKQYVGQHNVIYDGKYDAESGLVKGTWQIPGNWGGDFDMHFDRPAASQEEQEASPSSD
eukprot:GCRY01004376.1.p1 GENE.GCRY01004376.1~~GCRY01004376.1.p1  ORF type:complete len:456 (+),score=103.62 GCRY01004376.1:126-1493(+)